MLAKEVNRRRRIEQGRQGIKTSYDNEKRENVCQGFVLRNKKNSQMLIGKGSRAKSLKTLLRHSRQYFTKAAIGAICPPRLHTFIEFSPQLEAITGRAGEGGGMGSGEDGGDGAMDPSSPLVSGVPGRSSAVA